MRTAAVWRLLEAAIAESVRLTGRSELDVLDAGGGTGILAVPIAELGHRVTVVDPDPDSLAALERRTAEAGVVDRVRGVQGEAAGLLDVVPAQSVDVAVCHSVLEFVDDPVEALRAVAAVLRPGGLLSLLAANRYAVVLAKAVTGHVGEAGSALRDPAGRWGASDPVPRRYDLAELRDLVVTAGLRPNAEHGVGVFTELVPGALADELGGWSELTELEREAADRPAFRDIATQLHLTAQRP